MYEISRTEFVQPKCILNEIWCSFIKLLGQSTEDNYCSTHPEKFADVMLVLHTTEHEYYRQGGDHWYDLCNEFDKNWLMPPGVISGKQICISHLFLAETIRLRNQNRNLRQDRTQPLRNDEGNKADPWLVCHLPVCPLSAKRLQYDRSNTPNIATIKMSSEDANEVTVRI